MNFFIIFTRKVASLNYIKIFVVFFKCFDFRLLVATVVTIRLHGNLKNIAKRPFLKNELNIGFAIEGLNYS